MKRWLSTRSVAREKVRAAARSRRGSVLIIGIVILVVVTLVEGTLVQSVLSRRRQLVGEERTVQAQWLLESGLSRAKWRLLGSETYRGETWEIPPEQLNGRDSASVVIDVETQANPKPDEVQVRIITDFPRDSVRRDHEEQVFWIRVGRKAAGDGR